MGYKAIFAIAIMMTFEIAMSIVLFKWYAPIFSKIAFTIAIAASEQAFSGNDISYLIQLRCRGFESGWCLLQENPSAGYELHIALSAYSGVSTLTFKPWAEHQAKFYSFCHNRNLPLAVRKQWELLSSKCNYFTCRQMKSETESTGGSTNG